MRISLFTISFFLYSSVVHSQSFKLGTSYQGGKIFYINSTGKHGLVASLKDQSGAATWKEALKMCMDLRIAGYSGWRLPTIDELRKLYDKRTVVGSFSKLRYWSGTEFDKLSVKFKDFGNGNENGCLKNFPISVRAIRSF